MVCLALFCSCLLCLGFTKILNLWIYGLYKIWKSSNQYFLKLFLLYPHLGAPIKCMLLYLELSHSSQTFWWFFCCLFSSLFLSEFHPVQCTFCLRCWFSSYMCLWVFVIFSDSVICLIFPLPSWTYGYNYNNCFNIYLPTNYFICVLYNSVSLGWFFSSLWIIFFCLFAFWWFLIGSRALGMSPSWGYVFLPSYEQFWVLSGDCHCVWASRASLGGNPKSI